MIISSSNIIGDATITVDPVSPTQDVSALTDGDFSTVYSEPLIDQIMFSIEFPAPTAIGYLAIGGSNISKKDRIEISISEPTGLNTVDDDELYTSDGFRLTVRAPSDIDDDMLGLDESCNIMYRVDIPAATRIDIVVTGGGTLTVADIALGDYYEVPNGGEQGGYNRPWTVPNIQGRTATNLQHSPIAMTYEGRALSCTLSIPNNLMSDFDAFYEMARFCASNTFYVLEDDNKFHSYAGFNAVINMTQAHSQTRLLGVSQMRFNAFAKSSEAFI